MSIKKVQIADSLSTNRMQIKHAYTGASIDDTLAERISGTVKEQIKKVETPTFTPLEFWGTVGTVFTTIGLTTGLILKRQFKNIKLLKSNIKNLQTQLTQSACKAENLKSSLNAEKQIVQQQADSINNLTRMLNTSETKTANLSKELSDLKIVSQEAQQNAQKVEILTEKLNKSQGQLESALIENRNKSQAIDNLTSELNQTQSELAATRNLTQTRGAKIEGLTKDLDNAHSEIGILDETIRGKDKEISSLNGKLTLLDDEVTAAHKKIAGLEAEVKTTQKTLQEVLNEASGKKVDKILEQKIEKELATQKLNYDPMKPFFRERPPMFKPEQYTDEYAAIKTGTTNRADMVELKIPEIKPDGSFDFELPAGAMKVRKPQLRQIEPYEIDSTISEKYAQSVNWNDDKGVRDALQNYLDGHGQTLDGVRMIFKPLADGRYRVRIEGKSLYDHKHAIIMGESTSHEIEQAAGNYGEGLKMVTLKLLKQNEASSVRIGSGNWKVTCSFKRHKALDSELMHYHVEPVEHYDGNFLEFETTNRNLLETFRNSINRFYHSSNPHFKKPDFENELFGIKLLPKGENGGLYISGQRFEYGKSYDGVEEAAIFIKRKIPDEVYDMSRDRGSINFSSFWDISRWLAENSTAEEQKQIIKILEPHINKTSGAPTRNLLDRFIDNLRDSIIEGKTGAIKFPDRYIADSSLSSTQELKQQLTDNGFKIFPGSYENLGMQSITNIVLKARQHKPIQPAAAEEKKILILKRALNKLQALTEKHFTPEELDARIHIFDAKAAAENSVTKYDDALAEAILDGKVQKGFWIDREYLNKGKFGEVFETALHELSHKVGADGTMEHGYELTKVNKIAIAEILEKPEIAREFKVLSDMWAKLS